MLTGSKATKQEVTAQAVLDEVFGKSTPQFEISVYVPSTLGDVVMHTSGHNVLVSGTRAFINKFFGGSTSRKGVGSYTLESGKVVVEPVTIVSTIVSLDESSLQALQNLREFAYHLGAISLQESVLITITPVKAAFLTI